MITWTDILHPIRFIRKIRNEWYERREAREIFLLLEELELPNDYEPTPDLPVRILQRVEQYEAEKRAGRPRRPIRVLVPAVAAIFCITFGVWWTYSILEPHKQIATQDTPTVSPQDTPRQKNGSSILERNELIKESAEIEKLTVQIAQALPQEKQSSIVVLDFIDPLGSMNSLGRFLADRLSDRLSRIPGIVVVDRKALEWMIEDLGGKLDDNLLALRILPEVVMRRVDVNILIKGIIYLPEDNRAKLRLSVLDLDTKDTLFSTILSVDDTQREFELLAKLISNIDHVEQVIEGINEQVQFTEALYPPEAFKQALSELSGLVKAAQQQLAEEGEYWMSLAAVFDVWEARQQRLLELSKSNPAFKHLADRIKEAISNLISIREDIISTRAELESLAKSIEEKQEIIIHEIEMAQSESIAWFTAQEFGYRLTSLTHDIKSSIDKTKKITENGAVAE